MGQGTCAVCKGRLTDHDGSIVYFVYTKEELVKYNKRYLKLENPEVELIFCGDKEFNYSLLWLCNKCKTANVWSENPKKFRAYKMKENRELKINLEKVKKMKEIFIINSLDDTDNIHLEEYTKKNPFRPFEYYISEDFCYVYIINFVKNCLDRVYVLTLEID